jgi:hypothetical protein
VRERWRGFNTEARLRGFRSRVGHVVREGWGAGSANPALRLLNPHMGSPFLYAPPANQRTAVVGGASESECLVAAVSVVQAASRPCGGPLPKCKCGWNRKEEDFPPDRRDVITAAREEPQGGQPGLEWTRRGFPSSTVTRGPDTAINPSRRNAASVRDTTSRVVRIRAAISWFDSATRITGPPWPPACPATTARVLAFPVP